MRLVNRWVVLSLLLILSTSLTRSQEQQQISIHLPGYLADAVTAELLMAFEAEYNVDVVVLEPEIGTFFASPFGEVEAYLDDMERLVSRADVVYIDAFQLTPMLVRTGYLLNLEPLIQTNPDLEDDFYPGLLESFRWDSGLWAIPIGWTPIVVNYDREVFDTQGLAYPDATWELDDYANAAQALVQYDAAGDIILPGLIPTNIDLLLRTLAPQPLYIVEDGLHLPNYMSAELADLVEDWMNLSNQAFMQSPTGGLSYGSGNLPPLLISDIWFAAQSDESIGLAPLPGNQIGLHPQMLAVSSGTIYPDIAFALIDYLSQSPTFTEHLFSIAARESVVALQEEAGLTQRVPSPQLQALLAETQVLPWREVSFGTGIWNRLGMASMVTDTDVEVILQQAQTDLQTQLEVAAMRQDTVVVVEPPPLQPELAPGEIALRFGAFGGFNAFAVYEPLEHLAEDFAATHPTIGYIDLDLNYSGGLQSLAQEFDCFISSPDYGMTITMMTDQLISLDPLMDADPNFDPALLAQGVLQRVTANGQIWALPINIEPEVLFYDPEQFIAAGLPLPDVDWSTQEFEDALRALQRLNPDAPAFGGDASGTRQLFILIYAYGVEPFDADGYLNTDPTTIDELRQVLNLVKEGLIAYAPPEAGMTTLSRSSGVTPEGIQPGPVNMALGYTLEGGLQSLNAGLVNYPTSPSGPIILNYQMQAAYISATAVDPQACYDWISLLSRDPSVQQNLPANTGLLADPTYQATVPADLLAFYQDYVAMMSHSNTQLFSEIFSSNNPIYFASNSELTTAINAYLSEESDLAEALMDAQERIEEFSTCLGDFETLNPDTISQQEIEQLQSCFERYLPG